MTLGGISSMISVLFVDDDVQAHKTLRITMENRFRMVSAFSAEHAIEVLTHENPDVVLLDVNLPGRSGLELLQQITANPLSPPVIMLSAESEVSVVVKAIQAGAYDYTVKPWDLKKMEGTILCAASRRLQRCGTTISESAEDMIGIIGESPAIRQVRELIRKYSGYTSSVLISGKSGTGKELVAHALHRLSSRSNGPFVAINCGAIPQNIIETELFGSEQGAFTDARERPGSFERADCGTLFLDEIGEMPLVAQVKLLRVLEEKRIMRVGGSRSIPVDVRVVSATNKELAEMVSQGLFREDLYYRISVLQISLPELCERSQDIMLLALYFINVLSSEKKQLGADAREKLSCHRWPGNIRELKNVIERALIHVQGDLIRAQDIVF